MAGAQAATAAGTLYIQGGGYGHGVGMSQYGAYGYALHGADYQSILAHYYQGTSLGTTNPNQIIRVLLATGRPSFRGASAAGTIPLQPGTTYTVKALPNGALGLVTTAGKAVNGTFAAPLTVTGPGPLQVIRLGTYQGSLQFTPAASGKVQTVNAVGLDDYVEGVVPSEMPSSWSLQALEAQAVAARTYAITTSVGGPGYDLYADTRSQVYGGVNVETAATDAAVTDTSGQIVTYNGQPAVTYFFSSSGGYTESIQNVWHGATPEAYLTGVPDPYDNAGGDPYHHWSYRMSLAAAARKLGSLVRGKLLGITVTKHGVSPRIIQAQVVGTGGRTTVTGAALQQAFGLPTTYAAFSTISTTAAGGQLTGTAWPSSNPGAVAIQTQIRGSWRTVARERIGRGGSYSATLRRSGVYRVKIGRFAGPAIHSLKVTPLLSWLPSLTGLPARVTVYAGSDAWPAAGN